MCFLRRASAPPCPASPGPCGLFPAVAVTTPAFPSSAYADPWPCACPHLLTTPQQDTRASGRVCQAWGPWDRSGDGGVRGCCHPKPREPSCAPGTDLEPPRAGKDPDQRPEEMLGGQHRSRRAEGGGAEIQEDRHKRNRSEITACPQGHLAAGSQGGPQLETPLRTPQCPPAPQLEASGSHSLLRSCLP